MYNYFTFPSELLYDNAFVEYYIGRDREKEREKEVKVEEKRRENGERIREDYSTKTTNIETNPVITLL